MFSFSTTGKSSLQTQVDELKKKWDETAQKNKTYLEKYKELVQFTNTLSDSYINSVQVIIDVSALLQMHTELIAHITNDLKNMEQWDTSLTNPAIVSLKNSTLENLEKIRNWFEKDYSKISSAITGATSNKQEIENLQKVKDTLARVTTNAKSTLSGGGKYSGSAYKKNIKSKRSKSNKLR